MPHSENASALVEALDLSSVRSKLMDPVEGVGWTEEQTLSAEKEYKRFLVLLIKYASSNRSIVPNGIIDTFWHFHILDTRRYHEDSQRLFGGYLHHDPNFGVGTSGAHDQLLTAFEDTKALYQINFGTPMSEEKSGCSSSCRQCKSCRGVA